MTRITVHAESDLDQVIRVLKPMLNEYRVVLLIGEMGAGKTTLTKRICARLGVKDEMSSPTFSIVNQYLNDQNEDIYHFDFYRLESFDEALNIGVEEYFYSGNLCLIEWPEIVAPVIPEKYVEINIKLVQENREITITPHG